MKQSIFWLGWAAPVMLLAAGPVLAQQTVPPRGGSPSGVNDSNQTRGLESEIEQYPGRSDGMRGDSASDARIPEELQPPPRKPSQAPRSQATTPAAPGRGGAPASTDARSSIDPSEVQRVFGTDAQIVSLGSLDAASITRLQVRLHELGHYKGTIDGVMGPQTRAAIDAYARAQLALKQRLLKQDQLTPDLAEQLGVASGSLHTHPPASGEGAGPGMDGDAPRLPPGGAPLPPPGIAPLPTPTSSPGAPARGGSTPATPPPSP